MSCFNYYSPPSLDSSLTVQFKLTQIWKTICYSNPLFAGLVGVETVPNADMIIIDRIELEGENIVKRLGTSIDLQLVRIENKFYFQLSAACARIWTEMRCTRNLDETGEITTDTEEALLVDKSTEDLDHSASMERSILQSITWPNTVFSVIKTALENFSSKPRYSKEARTIHFPSSVIDSTLAIARGEVLCIKIYRPRAGVLLTSFYHFGVYVAKMTTKDGTELEHAVIELTKTRDTGSIFINAVPLEGYEKGTCFVMKKTKSGRLPLLFKVVYGRQTQQEKNETANRALDFYKKSEHYLENYNLFSNNCEHFVNICAFGNSYCEQHVRFVITTLPNFLNAACQVLQIVLVTITEVAIETLNCLRYLGEVFALMMLMVEYAVRIIWDIYLLKKSGRLTRQNVLYLLKRRTLSIAPELLVGIGFLLVAILCTFGGPVGAIIGISGTVIMILLRFIARPRIERWIERREAARLEDFLQWHPHEVARLAMDTSEENDVHEKILANFQAGNLSGKVMSELINRERENPFENHLANALHFLDLDRLKRFKQNLKSIFGHFDISEQLRSPINLTYNERVLSIENSFISPITVRQLLDTARFNWQINFKKGDWQVSEVNHEDGRKLIIASSNDPDSLSKQVPMIPDTPTTLELIYKKSTECTLL